LEKQTSAVLKFFFRFRPRLHPHNRHVILHEAVSSNQTILGGVTMSSLFKVAGGERRGAILLPVSDWVRLSSRGQCLSAHQISSG